MKEFSIEQMQAMQSQLQTKYQDQWETIGPEAGKHKLLWLMIELGEVADILKKQGEHQVMKNETVRKDFVEEMADVLMYFNDVLMCFDIDADELKESYIKKHQRNMTRW